ncbi:hypothetical protein IJ182_07605 [bacterium]|nr:hypothetical protein [bacterium]
MINSVSTFGNLTVQKAATAAEVKQLVKYVNNEALQEVPDTFQSTTKNGAKSVSLFNFVPFVKFLINKHKAGKQLTGGMTEALVHGDKATVEAFKGLFKKEGGKFSEKLTNLNNVISNNASTYNSVKTATKAAIKANKLAKKIVQMESKAESGSKLVNLIRNLKLEKAKIKYHNLGRTVGETIEKTTKGAIINEGVKEGAQAVSKMGKFGKYMKSSGAGIMLAFSGVAECLTEVVPTFKELGKEKGIKQIGKSTVKVVGDTAGFIAGQTIGKYAGSIIGAKIGATIGSAVPGIGTVIGGAAGLVCGMLGSFIAGKITKAIVGKSEREIAKEQKENDAANAIAKDANALKELKQIAQTKLQQEKEANVISADSAKIEKMLAKLNQTNNPKTRNMPSYLQRNKIYV